MGPSRGRPPREVVWLLAGAAALYVALPVLIALLNQPLDAVWVLAFIVVYQQFENMILSPRITARTMAMHPAVAFGA